MRILLTGGGTGGHVFPILAVIGELKRLSKEPVDFLWIGSRGGPEQDSARKLGIPYKSVCTGKFRRYFSWHNFLDIFKIPIGKWQAFFIIKKFRPDVIFSKGGYVSIPAVLAGWILGISSLIHESDTVPGLANRFLGRFANKVAISFKETKKHFPSKKYILTGNPVRPEILEGSKEKGFRYFGLEYGRPVILVTGGSQGSRKINEVVIKALSNLLKRYQIIHLCGERNLKDIRTMPRFARQNLEMLRIIRAKILDISKKYYKLYPFLPTQQMAGALAVADLVISRAGANVLAELAVLGKPSILIPLPTAASDHQRKNARVFEKNEAAWVIEEKNLTWEVLIKEIDWLMKHRERLDKMSGNVLKLARPNAARRIAEEILNLAKK